MIFKVYNSDFGIKLNGVNYDFTHVDSLTIEDPEYNRLVRGANANNKEGLIYKEGGKEPKRVTVTIMGMTAALKAVLDGCFQDKSRIDAVYCIDRTDGSGKMAKNAILAQQPQQLTVDESPESMSVQLIFESFDLTEVHKA
jgi:hypothetical protein